MSLNPQKSYTAAVGKTVLSSYAMRKTENKNIY